MSGEGVIRLPVGRRGVLASSGKQAIFGLSETCAPCCVNDPNCVRIVTIPGAGNWWVITNDTDSLVTAIFNFPAGHHCGPPPSRLNSIGGVNVQIDNCEFDTDVDIALDVVFPWSSQYRARITHNSTVVSDAESDLPNNISSLCQTGGPVYLVGDGTYHTTMAAESSHIFTAGIFSAFGSETNAAWPALFGFVSFRFS